LKLPVLTEVADAAYDDARSLCMKRRTRASQLIDLSGIGGDAGISHNTVRQWVGVLEAGFIAFRLEPYFENFSKRIIKVPKFLAGPSRNDY
jgi:predicted AAA+ superfamily ATPase